MKVFLNQQDRYINLWDYFGYNVINHGVTRSCSEILFSTDFRRSKTTYRSSLVAHFLALRLSVPSSLRLLVPSSPSPLISLSPHHLISTSPPLPLSSSPPHAYKVGSWQLAVGSWQLAISIPGNYSPFPLRIVTTV